MESVLLLGAVQAVFLSFLLVSKKNKSTPDYILVALLFFTAIPLFLYFIVFDELSVIIAASKTFPSFMYFINVPFIMTFAPSVFLYIKSSLKPQQKFFLKNAIHFIPVLVFILLSFLYVDFSEIKKINFNFFNLSNFWLFLMFTPITIILAFFYIFFSFKMFASFKKKIKQNFSYTDDIDLKWLKIILIIVSTSWAMLFVVAIIVGSNSGNVFTVYKIVLFSLTLVVFLIAFFGFKQSNVFVSSTEKNDDKKNKNKKIVKEFNGDVKKLLNFMEKEKPFLENKLTLKKLANLLDWHPHYLSKIINDQLEKNFFEFVNNYRVEEFKNQLQKNKNYTILSVAFDSGFNSKSSFNRIFKDFTGITPSDFKKSVELTVSDN